jgi:histidinol-phosphatase (PHP family)
MVLHNYHTHTKRCHHAIGEDREYVEKAIKSGIKTLGFSDHAPYILPLDNNYSAHRILLTEAEDYVHSVRSLAKEYAKDIRILCGFELEYYPDFHKEEMAYLKSFSPDYLILGQHFLGDEKRFIRSSALEGDAALTAYVTQAIAGLATGDFLYLAHPDLAGFRFSEETLQYEYRRLCQYAKAHNIPLELNLLGIREKRHYPSATFFKIAAEVGNDILIGIDAHSPDALGRKDCYNEAMALVKSLNLRLIETPLL